MTRKSAFAAILPAVVLSGMLLSMAGCLVPPLYRLPAGFSSTYHRQLYPEPIAVEEAVEEHPPAWFSAPSEGSGEEF